MNEAKIKEADLKEFFLPFLICTRKSLGATMMKSMTKLMDRYTYMLRDKLIHEWSQAEKADLKEFLASTDVQKEEFGPSHGEVHDQINRQVNEHTDGQINLWMKLS